MRLIHSAGEDYFIEMTQLIEAMTEEHKVEDGDGNVIYDLDG